MTGTFDFDDGWVTIAAGLRAQLEPRRPTELASRFGTRAKMSCGHDA